MTPLVFLMGVGPLARWKQATLPDLWRRLRWALGVSVVTALLLPFAIGEWTPASRFGLLLALWIVATTVDGRLERGRGVAAASARSSRAAAQLLGHDRSRTSASPCSSSASRWSRATRPSATCGWTSATPSPSAATRSASTASRRCRARTTARRAARSRVSRGGEHVDDALSREAHLQRGRHADDRGGDRQRPPSATSTCRSASPSSDGAWSVRVYHKPFVDWIWGGCLLMALGGLLALSDRRYRVAQRRARSPSRGGAAAARARCDAMKHRSSSIPLAVFVVLVGFLFVGPLARSARGALAADRQAGARLHARAAARRRRRRSARADLKGTGLAAERLGVVVRVVPRGASAAGRAREGEASSRSSASTTRTSPAPASAGSRRTAIRTTLSVVDRDGRVGIDYGVYGVPETFVIDKAGMIRYKQIGPITAEALRTEDPAAGPRAAEVMSAASSALGVSRARSRSRRSRLRRRRGPDREGPGRGGARGEARREAALPRLPEPDDRRLERRARAGPAPADPRADRRRQERRARSSTTWSRATATSCSTSRRSRRRRCCSGAGRRCCSWSARSSSSASCARRRAPPTSR